MAFLTIEQAAREFGASAHTLRIVAKNGRFPGARKIGGRWYIHRPTLERYFAGGTAAVDFKRRQAGDYD